MKAIIRLLLPFVALYQSGNISLSGQYRTYGIEVALENDSIEFEYKVLIESEDTSPGRIFRTSSLDTFLLLSLIHI